MLTFLENTFQSALSDAQKVINQHSRIWPKAEDTRSKVQALINSVDENEMSHSLTINFVIALLNNLEVLTDELNEVNILDSEILIDVDESIDSFVNLEFTENPAFNDGAYDDFTTISQRDYHSFRFQLLLDKQRALYLNIQIAQKENVNIKLPLSSVDPVLLNDALKSNFKSFLYFILKTQGVKINGNLVKLVPSFDHNQIFSRLNTIANPQFELSQILSEALELAHTEDFFKGIDLGSNNGQYLLRTLRVFSQQLGNCSVMPSLFNLFNMHPVFAQGVEIENVNDQIICKLLANLNKTRGSSLKQQAVNVLSTYCIDAYINQKDNIADYFYNLLLMLEEMEVESLVDLFNLYLENDFVERFEHVIYHLPESKINSLITRIESLTYGYKSLKGYILNKLILRLKEFTVKTSPEALKLLEVLIDSLGKSITHENVSNFHNLSKIISTYCLQTPVTTGEAKDFLKTSNGVELNTTEFLKFLVETLLTLSASDGFPYLTARDELINILQANPKGLSEDLKAFVENILLNKL